uniref:Uncharacterized protein n=1 Tax=Arundo donax TaxID=35708 RepID=A0A0A9F5W8_ARUDO
MLQLDYDGSEKWEQIRKSYDSYNMKRRVAYVLMITEEHPIIK